MPHTGELLGGRYRLDDRIAAGGMGEVWQATDTVLGRAVAVKTLLADRATDPGFQRRFRHEAQALAALRHPGVVPVYDFGNTAVEDAYLVMARVEGQPLNRVLAERGRLSPAETMSVVAQAAHALEAAHEAGIVHRDVKPGNLLIEPDGTVVLVDFGVARSAHSGTVTGVDEVVGTALYIAPEQVAQHVAGPPADVYALGALAYHCLAGHPPFEGRNPIAIALQHLEDEPPELPGDVPPDVREMVRIALSKKPEDRFPSAGVMAEAAHAAATSSGVGSAVPGAGSPLPGTGSAAQEAAGSPAGPDDLTATRAGSPWIGVLGMQPLDDTVIGHVLDDTAPGTPAGTGATNLPRQRAAAETQPAITAGTGPPGARPTVAGGAATTTRPAAPAPPGAGATTGTTIGRRRLLPLLALAAVALLGGLGVLVAADPMGWFADEPKPTTNAPAAPVSSAPRSAKAPAAGGDEDRETTRPERTAPTENDDRPTNTATATRPAAPTATTEPTATETTAETTTPTATATTPAETGEPNDDTTEPGDDAQG
ncbi:serine/threonine-protein kinase [Actinoplanes sp. NPDC026670]|uniref:serine/threonine-protein kinase n=1 Tax=Actinoplanes sp. NPDC026670 TaxID=3154700 RepID=UPI0033EA6D1C